MKFDYLVKHNGVWYKPGEEVPIEGDKPSVGVSTPKKEETVEETKAVAEVEKPSTEAYTKTEINRMSTADLKSLAKKHGLDESMSGAELKKVLIDKLV